MFDVILNLVVGAIFLHASAGSAAGPLPANTLPLAEKKIEAKIPERDPSSDSLGVKVTAKSYIVVEPESGAVLYEKNSRDPRAIASITKLMTALVFLDTNPDWNKQITMQAGDFRDGAAPVLKVGDKVSVKDVFYAMMVASSNEAANALARSTGLSSEDFAYQMNLHAYLLQMNGSKFVEPTGLSASNQASAEDLIKLIKVAFSHSEMRKAGSTKNYTIRVINKNEIRNLSSTDKALKEDFGTDDNNYKIEMGKTGYIDAAGYCFASQVKDEKNRTLLIAVLGSSSTFDRFTDTKSLAYWVFNNYKW
ncbi:MAG: serine hydrolase [Candidatus Buchananbacteria bacterium]|jgi:D-alanyl-D-alanine endopeptidase (penicillin-binding protein 7)